MQKDVNLQARVFKLFMMRTLIILISFVLSFSFVKAQSDFTITGNVKGLKDNTSIYLISLDKKDTLAKSTVQNEAFVLKGKTTDIDSRFLVLQDPGTVLIVFMGNDQIQIKGDVQQPTSFRIDGSQNHRDYEEFLYYIKPLNDYINFLRGELQVANKDSQKHGETIVMMNTVYNIMQQTVDQYIKRKNSSPASSLVLAYLYDVDPEKNTEVLKKRLYELTAEAKTTRYFKGLEQMVNKSNLGAVGSKALDFTQNDPDGKPVSLSQFKGKYVLIDFWASWCRPCRIENPNVVAAYNEFKNKGFTILGVSLDQNKTNWLKAIKDDNLTWTQISDLQFWNNAVARAYSIESIPQNLLIDPNGTIIAKNLRGEELRKRLREFIK